MIKEEDDISWLTVVPPRPPLSCSIQIYTWNIIYIYVHIQYNLRAIQNKLGKPPEKMAQKNPKK